MYNYFKFNGTQVNLLALVTEIGKPYLPSKSISTIDVTSRDGLIFDGSKYNSMKVPIELKIIGTSKEDYKERVQSLNDLFSVKREVPLSFCPNTEIWGILSGEFNVKQKNFCTGYADIEIVIHNPYTSSEYILPFHQETETDKFVTVINGGHEPTKPFISIGFSENAHFVQLENKTTGEKILIGRYPKLQLSAPKLEKVRILRNDCQSLTEFNITGANIDSDRSTTGTFAISEDGHGIILGTMGDGQTSWKGACARLSIGKDLDEFTVSVNMVHNSTGKNGDPNKFDPDEDTIKGSVLSGKKETYYQVTCSRLNVRSGGGTKYKKIGSLTKGYKITKGTETKGWLKFNYSKSKVGYVSMKYVKKKYKTTEVIQTPTYTVKNMWVMSTEFGNTTNGGCKLWSSPNPNSKIVCIIPFGTCVRITTKEFVYKWKDESNQEHTKIYYKLYKKYNNKYIGYIDRTMLKDAFEMDSNAVDYSSDPTRADDKTGTCELYGFDVNGNQLFKISMIDDNQWFEYTRPEIRAGSRVILKDTNKTPKPDEKVTAGENSYQVSNYLSGKYGGWNEFYGTLTLTRKKENGVYKWEASVTKKDKGNITKTQVVRDVKYSDLPQEGLNYLAMYLGTKAKDVSKISSVSVTHIVVHELNPQTEQDEDIVYFQEGDVLDIDFDNGDVYLNEENRNDLVDIGSTYFDILPGEHEVAMFTDDKSPSMDVAIKERWLGVVDEVVSTIPPEMDDTENGQVII